MLEGPYLFLQLSGASAQCSSQTWLISNREGRVYTTVLKDLSPSACQIFSFLSLSHSEVTIHSVCPAATA